jgi:hypothetical protein
MKSKKYLRKNKKRLRHTKKIRKNKYTKKGGFPEDTINYNNPIMKMYNQNYMEKSYLNI